MKKTLGVIGLSGGAVGVGYAGYKLGWFNFLKGLTGGTPSNYVLSPTVTFAPGLTTPYPLGPSTATAKWQNPSTKPITYGVQGYIVASGVVNGHWWTSLSVAQAALAASRAHGITALAPYVANVPDRVQTVTVQPGQQGTAKLYAQLASPETEQWIILIRPQYTGGLVATDPQGANASSIAQTGDSGLSATVTVG